MPDRPIDRVLMTGDTVGGVWTFTLELSDALGQSGIEVILASLGGEPTVEQQEEAAGISNLRLLTSRYKLEWMDDPWDDVGESGAWLLDLEQRFAPDVIHLNSYGHGSLRFQAPVLMTAHSCVVSWWNAVKREPIPPPWNRYRYEVENALKAVDLLTAPSHCMLRTLEENYGPDLPPSRVVPNGRTRSRFNAAAKEPFILTAGRLWDEAKNVSALAHIAVSVPWPIYVAGESSSANGTTPRLAGCRPLGRLSPPAMAEWYGRAAIYALPARYEPFGLSVLEAALSGCALVLGDIDSLRETWDGVAVFVPPDDPDRLAAALRELIDQPPLRAELARCATARAAEFTPARMAAAYTDAYRSLARMRSAECVS